MEASYQNIIMQQKMNCEGLIDMFGNAHRLNEKQVHCAHFSYSQSSFYFGAVNPLTPQTTSASPDANAALTLKDSLLHEKCSNSVQQCANVQ